jgi:hypothetical protein
MQLYLAAKNVACTWEQERLEHIWAAFLLPTAAHLPD